MPDTPVIESRFATVNGVKLHYLTAGAGDPVMLLHGYAQTSHLWRPLMAEMVKAHGVTAPDQRGFGRPGKRARGYDKKTGRGISASWERRQDAPPPRRPVS